MINKLYELKSYLQEHLKLSHWDINIELCSIEKIHELMSDINTKACLIYQFSLVTANIYLDETCDIEENTTSLIHEMVHLILVDLNINIESEIVEERLVNTFTNLIKQKI